MIILFRTYSGVTRTNSTIKILPTISLPLSSMGTQAILRILSNPLITNNSTVLLWLMKRNRILLMPLTKKG